MDDRTVRAALERPWSASDAGDFDVEHEIYHEDALLDYPQSGERIRGRHNIQESRYVQPNKKRFAVRRMIGGGDLWVTEFTLSYDDKPFYAVSIMEFREGPVAHETRYFTDRFGPAPSRAHLVERMDDAAAPLVTGANDLTDREGGDLKWRAGLGRAPGPNEPALAPKPPAEARLGRRARASGVRDTR